MFKKNKSLEFNKNSTKSTFYKKSKITCKKVILSIFFLFFMILIGLTIILNKYLNKINKIEIGKNDLSIEQNISHEEATALQNRDPSSIQNNETIELQKNDIQNIALFGIDETEGTVGRSDCIMILTIDNQHSKLKLCSIIRDSYVTIHSRSKKISQRHRTVINQLIEKCKTISITQYPSLLDEALPLVHTNLGTSEILSLAVNINLLKNKPIVQDRFPTNEDGNGKSIDGIYYYVFDETLTIKKIRNFIYMFLEYFELLQQN